MIAFALVNIAAGMWVNPEDISALRTHLNGTRMHLRNGHQIQVYNVTVDDVIERLREAKEIHQ